MVKTPHPEDDVIGQQESQQPPEQMEGNVPAEHILELQTESGLTAENLLEESTQNVLEQSTGNVLEQRKDDLPVENILEDAEVSLPAESILEQRGDVLAVEHAEHIEDGTVSGSAIAILQQEDVVNFIVQQGQRSNYLSFYWLI